MAREFDIDIRINPDGRGVALVKSQFDDLGSAGRKAEESARRAGDAVDKMGGAARKTNEALGDTTKQMAATTAAASNMGRAFKHIIAYFTAFVSIATLKGMVNTFAEWDLALVNIAKTTDLTSREIDKLGQNLTKISLKAPLTATSLAAIAAAAGQVGVKGVDNLTKFSKVVADLVVSSNLLEEEAVFALKKILDLTGENINQAEKLASVWVAMGNNFAVTERQVAVFSREISKAMGVYGFASEHISAFGTSAAASGVAPDISRSTYQRVLGSINEAFQGNTKVLEKWTEIMGISSEEFRRLWGSGQSDERSTLLGYVLRGLGELGEEGPDALDAVNISSQRVQASLLSIGKTANQVFFPALKKANEEAKNASALATESERFYNAFSNILRTAANAWTDLKTDIGKQFAPLVLDMSDDFQLFIRELKESGTVVKLANDLATGLGKVYENIGLIKNVIGGWVLWEVFKRAANWVGKFGTELKNVGKVANEHGQLVEKQMSKTMKWVTRLGFVFKRFAPLAALFIGAKAYTEYEGQHDFAKKTGDAEKALAGRAEIAKQMAELESKYPSGNPLQKAARKSQYEALRAGDTDEYNRLTGLLEMHPDYREGRIDYSQWNKADASKHLALSRQHKELEGASSTALGLDLPKPEPFWKTFFKTAANEAADFVIYFGTFLDEFLSGIVSRIFGGWIDAIAAAFQSLQDFIFAPFKAAFEKIKGLTDAAHQRQLKGEAPEIYDAPLLAARNLFSVLAGVPDDLMDAGKVAGEYIVKGSKALGEEVLDAHKKAQAAADSYTMFPVAGPPQEAVAQHKRNVLGKIADEDRERESVEAVWKMNREHGRRKPKLNADVPFGQQLFGWVNQNQEYEDQITSAEKRTQLFADTMQDTFENLFVDVIPSAFADTVISVIKGTEDMGEAFKKLGTLILETIVKSLIEATVRALIFNQIAGFFGGGSPGTLPSPTPQSLPVGPGGGGGGPWGASNQVLQGWTGGATGGLLKGRGGPTADNIPALLSNGEFVVNARGASAFMPLLEAINGYHSGRIGDAMPSKGSAAPAKTQIVVEDHRPPGAPKLRVEAEQDLGLRQQAQTRLIIREETQEALRTGQLDSSFRQAYGARRQPVRR